MKPCKDWLFLLDLDSTLTKVEILPTIAESIGCSKQMRELTEQSMYQAIPFRQSFLERVDLLKALPVSEISNRIATIPLHEELVAFLRENRERCYIVTGNLDVWINGLIERIGMQGHVYCSRGIVREDKLVSVASVIDKNATVDQLVGGFVAVGDGSNDAEMVSRAEVGIGFGGVRPIAPSLLEVCTHAFYDEARLVKFLRILAGTEPAPGSKTVVISCAGMGKRLGIGTTKCLLDVGGGSLIERHLEQLDNVDDVRVVVGYQAEKVIEAVREIRNDATFVFNHEFANNGTGASVALASLYANERVLTLDGDLLVHPSDMEMLLNEQGDFIGVTAPGTDNPVLVTLDGPLVTSFSRDAGSFEWTGVSQSSAEVYSGGDGHVYQLLEPHLPMKHLYIRTKEIDTPNDYDNAVRWVDNGYSDDIVLGIVGGMGTYATIDLFKRIADALPAEKEWERPRIIIDNYCTMPSRVRAILYGEKREELVGMLAESTKSLIAAGCTDILYACNTSHVFHDEVAALVPKTDRYLMNMIDLLGRDMKAAGVEKAYLLASEGTILTGIYQDSFAAYDIAITTAGSEDQKTLREFIEIVKQNKVNEAEAIRFGEWLAELHANAVILGCTELPILYRMLGGNSTYLRETTIWDPMQSAIDAIVSKYKASQGTLTTD